MKEVFKKLFTKRLVNKPHSETVHEKQSELVREKKEAAFHEVGERYGRAITRLSDT